MSLSIDWALERAHLKKLPPEELEYYSNLLERLQDLEVWDPDYVVRRLEEFHSAFESADPTQQRRPLSYQGLGEALESLRQQLTGAEFDRFQKDNLDCALPRARVWRKLAELTRTKVSGTLNSWKPSKLDIKPVESKLQRQLRFLRCALSLIQARHRTLALQLRHQFAQALKLKGSSQQQSLDRLEATCCKQLSREDLQWLSEVSPP